MGVPPEVGDAARNNAEWCDAFCRTHGVAGRFAAGWWSSRARTPLFYPDAVTLVPGVTPEPLLSSVDSGAGCGIKDSFADLDLAPSGFEVLFRAEWLCRAETDAAETASGWSVVATPAGLERWESAWGGSPVEGAFFRRPLLGDIDVAILARCAAGRPAAGAVANRSRAAIGLTNVFAADGDLESAWTGAAGAARSRWGPLPVVGYAWGEALDAAHAAGFVTIGELAVWSARQHARSR